MTKRLAKRIILGTAAVVLIATPAILATGTSSQVAVGERVSAQVRGVSDNVVSQIPLPPNTGITH